MCNAQSRMPSVCGWYRLTDVTQRCEVAYEPTHQRFTSSDGHSDPKGPEYPCGPMR